MSTEINKSTSYLPTKDGDSYNYEPSNSPFITTHATEGFSSPVQQMSMEHATPLQTEETNAPILKKFFEETTTTTTTTEPLLLDESELGGKNTQVFEQKMVPSYHHGSNVNDPTFNESVISDPNLLERDTRLDDQHLLSTETHLTSDGRPVTETVLDSGSVFTASTTSMPSTYVSTIPASDIQTYDSSEITQTTNIEKVSPVITKTTPLEESFQTKETLKDANGQTLKETTSETIQKPGEVTESFTEKTIDRDGLSETTVETRKTQPLSETRAMNKSKEQLGYDDYYDPDTVHNVSSTEHVSTTGTTYNHGEPHKPSQMTKIKGTIKEKFGHLTKNKRMEEEGKILEQQFARQKSDYQTYIHSTGKKH